MPRPTRYKGGLGIRTGLGICKGGLGNRTSTVSSTDTEADSVTDTEAVSVSVQEGVCGICIV